MPTFQAPRSESPPASFAGNGLFSDLSSTPSGGSGPKRLNLFGKPSNGTQEKQSSAPSLFSASVNSTNSLDDLLTWPDSAKKPTAQKDTGFSLFSQPQTKPKEDTKILGAGLFGTNPANPSKPSLLSGAQPDIPSIPSIPSEKQEEQEQEEDMGPFTGPAMPDFAKSLFNRSTQGSEPPVKPVATFQNHDPALRSRVEDRKTSSKQQSESEPPKRKVAPRDGGSPLPAIIKDLAATAPQASIAEPHSLILETEDILSRLSEALGDSQITDEKAEDLLSDATNELVTLWEDSLQTDGTDHSYAAVGPGPDSSDFAKANFIASLVLPLHHPPTIKDETGLDSLLSGTPFQTLLTAATDRKTPIPKVLLKWVDRHHPALTEVVDAVRIAQPNPTSSSGFWKTLNYLVLRGQFSQAVTLLENADFSVARSALDDGYDTPGYRGKQLQNVHKVANSAMRTLRAAPANNDNWDIKGVEWSVYRKQVESAIHELDSLVQLQRHSPKSHLFDAPSLGLPNFQGSGITFTQASRMADAELPLTVYQRLRSMFQIILGDVEAILQTAQDWVEATVGLTLWWDGEDDLVALQNKGLSAHNRSVDENPREAYLRRLACTFVTATTDAPDLRQKGFQINSFDPIEVCLASVFEHDLEGVLRLLQTWSLPIAAAVAEIGAHGGWYNVQPAIPKMPGLSQHDLNVLNYGLKEKPLRKDDVVVNHAISLFKLGEIKDEARSSESWELALEILGRLDDEETMKQEVSQLIDQIPLDSAKQTDGLVVLCTELGFTEQSRKVSERYGDKIAQTSEDYGTALLCYARGHCTKKIKNIIDLLTSFCLVQSMAYPAVSDLDPQLRALLYDPQTSFKALSTVDSTAADLLNFYFCGYAAVRRFYEIRDEGLSLQKGERPRHRPLARKKAAAETLVALIRSASTCISGGLYDYEGESAIQVDGLMVLLGEALVFCQEPNRFFTIDQQYDILAAIEVLETVTKRVYDQCEECLQSTLYHHLRYDRDADERTNLSAAPRKPNFSFSVSIGEGLPPTSLLSKSVSANAAVSGFSLIENEILDPQEMSSDDQHMSTEGEHTMIRREWDWRTGIPEKIQGSDILGMLRFQLAKGSSYAALGN
ncbi:hypothetical protein KEM56_000561 [Ascosphaera pollenicola]|nr:hypothetical protein KEM56_000561 [Ascosphaera pollenicola]